jgi:glucose/arabinose dehydrogenase
MVISGIQQMWKLYGKFFDGTSWVILLLVYFSLLNRCFAKEPEIDLTKIHLPPGFAIQIFASDLGAPRHMAISPEGDLFVADFRGGRVFMLPDKDGDGKADQNIIFAEGLDRPHSVAFFEGGVYIATVGEVIRYVNKNGKGENKKVIISNIPVDGRHDTRTITFGPDSKLYLSIGSSCNVCEEKDPRRGTILQYNPDGTGEKIFAQGLRNAVGLIWHPQTKELWATEAGRDHLGYYKPPDEINIIKEGKHYGWPYCYGDHEIDSTISIKQQETFCENTTPPVIQLQAHSTPLGLTFYTGEQFPEEYRGNLFIALHGSWNRPTPVGYEVVRIKFASDPSNNTLDYATDSLTHPVKKISPELHPEKVEEFATGWLVEGNAWGRPVDVIVGKDGALYVSDDQAGVIYRIFYKGP